MAAKSGTFLEAAERPPLSPQRHWHTSVWLEKAVNNVVDASLQLQLGLICTTILHRCGRWLRILHRCGRLDNGGSIVLAMGSRSRRAFSTGRRFQRLSTPDSRKPTHPNPLKECALVRDELEAGRTSRQAPVPNPDLAATSCSC